MSPAVTATAKTPASAAVISVVAGASAVLAMLVVAVVGGIADLAGVGQSSPTSPAATAEVPAGMLALYQAATTAVCPQMPWQIVAAIGTVESDNGTSTLPGVHSETNPAGAEGPMQFEPATFAAYAQPVPPGGANPPSPYDPTDAVYAAVRMLCADGAGSGDLRDAIYAYNHLPAYVDAVWATAISYGMAADGSPGSSTPTADGDTPGPGQTAPGNAAGVIAYAETQLGVPYQWGGETPGVGLDCSGLVQLVYRAAGVNLPRTTFEQVTYGVTVPLDQLAPGDLLFFKGGTPTQDFEHVAIYIGDGLMIHAPYTGTVVQINPVPLNAVEIARRVLQ